jgi:CDP-glucose 4,6-dehydratase
MGTNFWRGRRVLVTGHTGFKGGWLCLWLMRLGARVTGYALAPDTTPSLFETARVSEGMTSCIGDIRDLASLQAAMLQADPEVVFHLAAQPLVRASYGAPIETFMTNVMGTAHVLECVRQVRSAKVVVAITTDKVYQNREWCWPYREQDVLGGHDPYSASKAACELVVQSYRKSFLAAAGVSVSSARAGNVIGGGDWAQDRLLPDCVRAFGDGRAVSLRHPAAVRPWQHVLDPLAGYLQLAQQQWAANAGTDAARKARLAQAFNFGPDASGEATAGTLAKLAAQHWGEDAQVVLEPQEQAVHEAGLLTLDPSLARQTLGWHVKLAVPEAVAWSVHWYRRQRDGDDARALCLAQIEAYENR